MGSVSKSVKGLAAGACAVAALAGVAALTARSGTATAAPAPAPRSNALCVAGETPIFSCPLGGKRVSVCGAGRQAVYRYGTPGKVELTARHLTLAQRGAAGGGETQIAVTNGDYTYVLYDRTERTAFGADGHHDADSRSGLLVRRGGRTLSARECDDDAPIPTRAATFIPAGGTIVAH